MSCKILVLSALVALAAASTLPAYTPQVSYVNDHPQYSYEYAVKDDYGGNDYGHQEARDGYDTRGSYRVLLPDGRVQTVTYYTNGDSGNIAEVTYQGEARYDDHSYGRPTYAPAPAYGAPAAH